MSSKQTIRFAVFAIAVLLMGSFWRGSAAAVTYNVNASVPYETPTEPAIISSPATGAVFADAEQTLSGTCAVKNPVTIISVVRGSTTLGSTECTTGSFSLAVLLQIGQNNLVVRTANVSGIYGPDSATVTVTLEKPTVAQPLPTGVNQPVTTESRQAATNEASIANLQVTTEVPYTVLPDTKVATLRVTVTGGQTPYVVQLQWGDGSTELRSVDQSGTYEFTHTYVAHKSYSVSVYVRDVLGAFTEYIYAVTAGVKSSEVVATTATVPSTEKSNGSSPWRLVGLVWYYWIFIIFIIVFLVSSYIVGYRRGRERAKTEAEQRAAASKKSQKRRKR